MLFPGFHSSFLYPDLRSSIPPLVSLLRDNDDKTKANAAGALGNFVRNSSMLVQSLIDFGALEALISLVASSIKSSSTAEFAQSTFQSSNQSMVSSQSPMKIALFSLGNMCAHPKCRDVLMSCGILDVTKLLLGTSGEISNFEGDSTVKKYAQRIESKIDF